MSHLTNCPNHIYFLIMNQDFHVGSEAQLCTSCMPLGAGKGSEWFAGQWGGVHGHRNEVMFYLLEAQISFFKTVTSLCLAGYSNEILKVCGCLCPAVCHTWACCFFWMSSKDRTPVAELHGTLISLKQFNRVFREFASTEVPNQNQRL